MNELETPTGVYQIDSLKQLVFGIRRALGLPSLDYEDLLQDVILFLLEGNTLSQSCICIRKKYRSWKDQVSYHTIPEMVIYDTLDRGNRKLTKHEKEAFRDHFYQLVDTLPRDDQNVILLRTFGLKHKEIAESVGSSEAAVRKRLERIIRRLKQ